jgi:hypothetical protein
MRMIASVMIILALALLIYACSEKISQPTDLPRPGAFHPDTSYIMISPAWTEADGIPFSKPSDVIIGYDRYVYIADKGNDRVVKLTLAGDFIESYGAPHPTQITQDRALDLLAVNDSSVVLRRSYREGGDFQVVYTASDVFLPPPNDTILVPGILFGIAASPFPDKTYSLSNYFENTIYRFSPDDKYSAIQVPPGVGLGAVSAPVAINSFDFNGRYLIGYTSGRSNYAIQLIDASTRDPIIPYSDSADIYLFVSGGYKDMTLDPLGNIFVSMATTSEVWKFDRNGVFVLKFGQDGEPDEWLDNPRGIDAYQEYIYVADTDNDRVIRYETTASPEQ